MRILPADQDAELYRLPDLVWNGLTGDLAINPPDHPDAPGDFRASQGLATQVLICLLTDARAAPGETDADDLRGWPGDSFDREAGETELGSKLWTLVERRFLFEGIGQAIEDAASRALQTLIDQGAVARVDVAATVDRTRNRVDLDVALYGRDGSLAYQHRFADLWGQIDGVAKPLA